jgi:hypothetical protein
MLAVVNTHLVDGDDIWVLQVGSGSRFVDEPLNLGFTSQAAGQNHLQSHVAAESDLPGPVHHSHAASPDLLH